jgi:hypothetical protein
MDESHTEVDYCHTKKKSITEGNSARIMMKKHVSRLILHITKLKLHNNR